jgi:hypothetical protein
MSHWTLGGVTVSGRAGTSGEFEVADPGSGAYVGGLQVIDAVTLFGGITVCAKADDCRIACASGSEK